MSQVATKKRPRRLTCCCCGQTAIGRQWWNRDTGYGLCMRCSNDWIKSLGLEETEHSCGKRGVHWGIVDEARKYGA